MDWECEIQSENVRDWFYSKRFPKSRTFKDEKFRAPFQMMASQEIWYKRARAIILDKKTEDFPKNFSGISPDSYNPIRHIIHY